MSLSSCLLNLGRHKRQMVRCGTHRGKATKTKLGRFLLPNVCLPCFERRGEQGVHAKKVKSVANVVCSSQVGRKGNSRECYRSNAWEMPVLHCLPPTKSRHTST